MLPRILFTAALVALAYSIGRELGRTQSIRDELDRARRARSAAAPQPDTSTPA
jgi:hypothetical protein